VRDQEAEVAVGMRGGSGVVTGLRHKGQTRASAEICPSQCGQVTGLDGTDIEGRDGVDDSSAAESGLPQARQKRAFAEMTAPQIGHVTVA
jgi:hypothetical protein